MCQASHLYWSYLIHTSILQERHYYLHLRFREVGWLVQVTELVRGHLTPEAIPFSLDRSDARTCLPVPQGKEGHDRVLSPPHIPAPISSFQHLGQSSRSLPPWLQCMGISSVGQWPSYIAAPRTEPGIESHGWLFWLSIARLKIIPNSLVWNNHLLGF